MADLLLIERMPGWCLGGGRRPDWKEEEEPRLCNWFGPKIFLLRARALEPRRAIIRANEHVIAFSDSAPDIIDVFGFGFF